jgi:hypothetical protein
MKNVRLLFFFLLIIGTELFLNSCSKDDSSNLGSKVSFYLTDAPSLQGYKAVNIDVQGVKYILNDSSEISLPITPTVYNLLELRNGKNTLLSNIILNEGENIAQVRLILGDNNSVVLKDGTEVSIKTPSAQTSGLKVNIQENVTTSSGYSVMIDFDAERSIVRKGNGSYSLKPVIRGYVVENTSAIYGNLLPKYEVFKVFTLVGSDTIVAVSDTTNNNYFMLHGLRTGNYTVSIQDPASLAILKQMPVSVFGGTDVDMGTIEIK